jgi:hypothetical protein
MVTMPLRLVVACVFLIGLLAAPERSHACRCVHPTVTTAVKHADLVFWGTIMKIEPRGTTRELTVHVRGVWKGSTATSIVVVTPSTSCGLITGGAKLGASWLFTARRAGNEVRVRQCDGSRIASVAARASVDAVLGPARQP